MYISNLTLLNFKNIASADISFDKGINCFVGDNGTCKTNIIDSIHYLSLCKSAFGATDRQSIRHGQQFFVLDGTFVTDIGTTEKISCSYEKGGTKVVKRSGKVYERLSHHLGLIPIVIVSPTDSALIADSAEERRRFINSLICQIDHNYLEALLRYNTTLIQRNRLLKDNYEENLLSIYDSQLLPPTQTIFDRRDFVIKALQPKVSQYYQILAAEHESVDMSYNSALFEKSMAELLSQNREKDRLNGYTTSGIHRDDINLTIDGLPIRRYGSQGQQKSFLIALRLAQYVLLSEYLNKKPILLLDDLFDRLDENRVARLLSIVSTPEFGQIIITDCNEKRMKTALDKANCNYKIFNVTYGQIL